MLISTLTPIIFSHSFGYECQKRSNLAVLAKDMVLYAAGNLVVLLRLDTQEQLCFRSLGGGGIGAIAVSIYMSYKLQMYTVYVYYYRYLLCMYMYMYSSSL